MPAEPTHSEDAHPFWIKRFWHHVVDDFPSAVFLSAAIAIIHFHATWLHALDEYAFVAVGNFYAHYKTSSKVDDVCSATTAQRVASATVLAIDPATYRSDYGEVSPLNRCKLREHIHRIYAAEPAVLAIDFDISPAIWFRDAAKPVASIENEVQGKERQKADECSQSPLAAQMSAQCQMACEAALYEVIKARGPETVLARPFSLDQSPEDAEQPFLKQWISDMELSGVTFGKAQLEVKFGLVRGAIPESRSLATKVYEHVHPLLPAKHEQTEKIKEKEKAALINPKKFLDGLIPVGMNDFLGNAACSRTIKGKAVFFGGSWGEGDTYLTPVGEVFGVDVHAASYLSMSDRFQERNVIGFMVDILLGILFGLLSAACWKKYFALRLSNNALQRQWAPLCIFFSLGAVFPLALALAVSASFALLVTCSIWASPVPMIVGMAIDTFVSKSLAEAIQKLTSSPHHVTRKPHGFAESVQRFFVDISRLWMKTDDPQRRHQRKYQGAASLLALRRMFWLGVVSYGIATLFMH